MRGVATEGLGTAGAQEGDAVMASSDELKRVAGLNLASAIEAKKHAFAEYAQSLRWLLASLLTINGGGALAMLSAVSLESFGRKTAGALFLIGMLSALLFGHLTMKSILKTVSPIGKAIEFWQKASHTGEVDASIASDVDELLKGAERPVFWAGFFGWVSAISFSIGAIAIGWNVE